MAEPKEFISKGRLDALIDGVFAFAMTLLLPEDFHPKSAAELVAGHAQILVVPDLEAGNMLAKNLIFSPGRTRRGSCWARACRSF